MPIVLELWIVCFLTLAAAMVILTIAYRALGSDLGVESVAQEAAIALVASALQALVLWASIAVIGAPHLYHFALAGLVAGFVYIATHSGEMERLEASIIVATQFLLYLVVWFLFRLGG